VERILWPEGIGLVGERSMEELWTMWGKFILGEEENVGVSLDIPEIDPLVTREKNAKWINW
jgi:hypothetical protein